MGYATHDGQVEENCVTECTECRMEFTGTGVWDVEFHDGYGTRRELHADEDTCMPCKGQGRCEGTFTHDEEGKYVAIKCDSGEGRTRFCIEDNGSRSHLGVYCADCNKFYEEDE